MIRRERTQRLLVVAGAFVVFLVAAITQVVFHGYVDADELALYGLKQRVRRIELPAERGPILDRNGDALAMTIEASSVFARTAAAELGWEQRILLARALDLPVKSVTDKLSSVEMKGFLWLRRNVTPLQAEAVAALGFPGIGSEPSRKRFYPRGTLASQVLGFSDIDGNGIEGVELTYDKFLRGERASTLVERDARNRYTLAAETQWDPRETLGATAELTLDAELQRITEDELSRAVESRDADAGVAIVMDVMTGEVLAMANAPLFDPNRSERTDPSRWRNRAILDQFEPGSTFKAFLAASALEAGTVWPEKRIDCENGIHFVGGRKIGDHEPQGILSFSDVIRLSSNIGVAKVAEHLGTERFDSTLRSFGFGQKTGVGLGAESRGLLRHASEWRPINLATISYGHGVSVTALQLVRAYAALANGGRLLRPYIVSRITSADGAILLENEPAVVGLPTDPQTASVVNEMLAQVVESGTGTAAAIEGVTVAGKTGTTRKIDPVTGKYSRRDYIASFAGFLPAESPRFAILVMIDNPRKRRQFYGGTVSGPVFRAIADYIADEAGYRIMDDPVPSILDDDTPLMPVEWGDADVDRMPSYMGLSLREALREATRAGWEVEVRGSGFVVSQDPRPGARAGEGRRLLLELGSALG